MKLSQIETVLNIDLDEAKENIRASSRLDIPWLKEVEPHDGVALICAGGPSMRDSIEEIRVRQKNGQKVFAINQVANLLNDHNIIPDYHFLLDALPSSAAFLTGGAQGYILASQCNPAAFEAVKNERNVILFHADGTFDVRELLPADKPTILIGGGVTALTRLMVVVHAMGYRVQHVYGADSSRRGKEHHAYKQADDDGLHEAVVAMGGRTFKTSLPMAAQVSEFISLMKSLAELDAVIHVHGDGLLPWACQVALNQNTERKAS